jgi:hypothetical protein
MNQTASFVVGDKAMALTDSGAKVTPPGECQFAATSAPRACAPACTRHARSRAAPAPAAPSGRAAGLTGRALLALLPLQVYDLRTGQALRLGPNKGLLMQQISSALDTQALVDEMQTHLAWAAKPGGSGH